MRPAPWIIVHDLDSPGSVLWTGPLPELCRANGWTDDERREMLAALRSGEGWTTGGGAAPAFMVALHDAEERAAA
jgi:hypothetical protein